MPSRLLCCSVVCACLLCLHSGCIMQSTGMSPSSVPITAEDTYTIIGPTSGSASGVMLWFLPIFESNPMDKAVRRAIENGGGNAMVEMTSDNAVYYFLLITIAKTRVEGTAVKYVKGGARQM